MGRCQGRYAPRESTASLLASARGRSFPSRSAPSRHGRRCDRSRSQQLAGTRRPPPRISRSGRAEDVRSPSSSSPRASARACSSGVTTARPSGFGAFVLVAGPGGWTSEPRVSGGQRTHQLELAFANVGAVLEAAGSRLARGRRGGPPTTVDLDLLDEMVTSCCGATAPTTRRSGRCSASRRSPDRRCSWR